MQNLDLADLRAHLLSLLPEYMVPSAYVRVDAMPVTQSGKLDRSALPAPRDAAYGGRPYTTPSTPLESALAEIWTQLLGLDAIGVHDNFFQLGGHSLLALRLAGQIMELLEVEIPVRIIFENPSIAALVECLESPGLSVVFRPVISK